MKINSHVEVIANCPSRKTLETVRINFGRIEHTPALQTRGIENLSSLRFEAALPAVQTRRIKAYSKKNPERFNKCALTSSRFEKFQKHVNEIIEVEISNSLIPSI